MKQPDGGPAFPETSYYDDKPIGSAGGMSLRDYFAAAALPTAMASYFAANGNGCAADHALRNVPALAYKYADAMLQERAK